MRRLEDELGVKLFERVDRDTMKLTAAGQTLYDYAHSTFAPLPSVIEAVRSHSYGGTLRFGAPRQLGVRLLPSWLAALRSERSDIRVEIHPLEGEPLGYLRQFEGDVIVEHLPSIPDDISVTQIAVIRGYLIAPRLETGRKIGQRQLNSMDFVSYRDGTPEQQQQRAALDYLEIDPPNAAVGHSTEELIALVAAGLGFSLVPSVVDPCRENENVVTIKMKQAAPEFAVYAASRKTSTRNPLIEAAMRHAPAWPPKRQRSTR